MRLFIDQRSIERVILVRTRAEGDDVCDRIGGSCVAWCGTEPRELYQVTGFGQVSLPSVIPSLLIAASQSRGEAI